MRRAVAAVARALTALAATLARARALTALAAALARATPLVARPAAPLAAALALLSPAPALAGTVALDRACYVERAPIAVAGGGFAPGAALSVSAGGAAVGVTADGAGAFALQLAAPLNPSLGARPRDVLDATLEVSDQADPAAAAIVAFRVVNFAFETTQGARAPTARRTWWFSGFAPGRPVYGHFRHRGRTRGTFRFGRARGACGLLSRRAAGIPLRRSRIRPGRWTVQIDQRRRYSAGTRPALRATTTVYSTGR